jgi:hypothetical protein
MSAALTGSPWLLAAFALAALLAMLGVLRHARGRGLALALLQPLLAALLLAGLVWPEAPVRGTLRVLTADASAPTATSGPLVALPGAAAFPGVARVPDLATALRRFPEVDAVHVFGRGLAPHDRAALGGRALVFAPAAATPDAPAFVELEAPTAARPGAPWTVRGRVAGARGAIELLDPAGALVAETTPDGQGRFALEGLSRAAGPMLFRLRLRRDDRILAQADVPVAATDVAPGRVLLLAGVPSPELKFLRRWALDAGLELESRVALAPRVGQRRGAAALDAAAFAGYDLVIADERSWAWLAPQREALVAALEDGLGLLLRVTGPLPPRVADEWRALGVDLQQAQQARPRETRFATADAPLHAWPVTWDGALPVPRWLDIEARPLAAWYPHGRGRVGAVWLADSFRLHTRGAAARHAALWADLAGTLARADGIRAPWLQQEAWVGRRVTLCGLPDRARVQPPDGDAVRLLTVRGCAAFWPRRAGWHRIQPDAPDPVAASAATWFHVPEAVAAAPRMAAADARDTAALASLASPPPDSASPPRWREALLLAALALAALVWWLERRWRPAGS